MAMSFGGSALSRVGKGFWRNQEFANIRLRKAQREEGEATGAFRQETIGQKQQGQAVSEGLTGLVESYNQAYGQARQANEQRYQQMLQIADQERQRAAMINTRMQQFAGQTTGQRAADIRSAGAEEEAGVMQRLRRLGMSGTTIAPTEVGGVRSRTEASLNRLADTMQQTQLGLMQRRADIGQGTRLGIMERRTDAYPDQSMLAGLVSSIGTGQKGSLIPSTFGALSKLRMG